MLMNEISVDEFGDIREREGEARGRKEGEVREKVRIVISMYMKGFTLDQIAGVTEKSVEEIKAIIANKEVCN